jgi:hypothetical protein
MPYSNQMTPVSKPSNDSVKGPDSDHVKVQAREHAADGMLSTPVSSGGKRTPSTTHPYSQSEAFANRHHHSERVDQLGRGIWTSYGPGGTRESPTGPAVEMYLRCNHEGCMRIDWRTVHGLQCHIVKSHEQPKGTIGSLEKALDRYGVPVSEVEASEREHGLGSAGTMADPKNQKIKNKTREMQQRFSTGSAEPGSVRRPYTMPSLSNSPPPPAQNVASVATTKPMGIGFRPSAMPPGAPMFPLLNRKSNEGFTPRSSTYSDDEEDDESKDEPKHEQKPQLSASRFGVAKGAWNRPDETPTRRDHMDVDKKTHKEDEEMYDAPPPAQPTAPKAVEAKENVPVMSNPVTISNEPDVKSLTASTNGPSISTAPSLTAKQHMTAEVERADKRQELEGSAFATPMTEPPAETSTQNDTKVGMQDGEAKRDEEKETDKKTEKEVEMTEDSVITNKVTSPPPQSQPQPQPSVITSPRSTRKPTSRRASAAVNKMEIDQDVGMSNQLSDDDGSRDEGEGPKDDGDTIISTGARDRDREQPTRTTRQANGRFSRRGRR